MGLAQEAFPVRGLLVEERVAGSELGLLFPTPGPGLGQEGHGAALQAHRRLFFFLSGFS